VDLPRISVDTSQDWKRVKNDFVSVADKVLLQKLSETGIANEDAVRAHLGKWIDATFDAAKPNLRVDGHNFEDYVENVSSEPFDEILDRRIWSLNAERIAWDKTLSDRRRNGPLQVQALVEEFLAAQDDATQTHPLDPSEVFEERSENGLPLASVIATHKATASLAQNLNDTIPLIMSKESMARQVLKDIM